MENKELTNKCVMLNLRTRLTGQPNVMGCSMPDGTKVHYYSEFWNPQFYENFYRGSILPKLEDGLKEDEFEFIGHGISDCCDTYAIRVRPKEGAEEGLERIKKVGETIVKLESKLYNSSACVVNEGVANGIQNMLNS